MNHSPSPTSSSGDSFTGRRSRWRLWIACLSGIIGLAACATPGIIANRALFDFLEHGRTSRSTVVLKLGSPSKTLEDDSILTYRIGEVPEEGYFVLDSDRAWLGAKDSLVLVFDSRGILRDHSLIPVK